MAVKPALKDPVERQIADMFTGGYIAVNKQLKCDFLDYCKDQLNYSDSTIKDYRSLLRLYLNYLGNTDIQALTITDVHAYFKERVKINKQESVNRDRAALRAFFLYIEKVRRIRLDFDYSMIRNARTEDPETKFVTIEQFTVIVDRLEEEQDKLIVAVMFAGALRISEVCKLSVENLGNAELRILGKGGKRRIVHIPLDLAERLQQFIYDNNRVSGPIFRHAVSKRTEPNDAYTPNGLRKRLYRLGVPVNPHAFRHGMATALAERGIDIRSLQLFLGHSRIDTVQRYWHIKNEKLRANIQEHFPEGICFTDL